MRVAHEPSVAGEHLNRLGSARPYDPVAHDMAGAADRQPRVLHVIHSLRRGGLERVLIAVANGLTKRGIPQAICCQHELGALRDAVDSEVDLFVLRAGPNDPRTPFRLRRIIRDWRPDVLHSEDFSVWAECVAALRCKGSPFHMHTFHGFLETPPRRWRGLGRILAGMTHDLYAVSHVVAKQVAETFTIPVSRVNLLQNGVDCYRFRPNAVEPAAIPWPGRSSAHPRVICVSVASLKPVKNPALLVQAAARTHANAHFVWVGDGPLRDEVEDLAKRLGVADRFTLAGAVDDVRPWLEAADLFVLSSDREAAPVGVLEAMSMGLAIVATRTGDLADRVELSGAGLLTATQDPKELAAAIDRLGRDPALRRRMGDSGRRHIEKHASQTGMLGRYLEAYEQCRTGVCSAPAG